MTGIIGELVVQITGDTKKFDDSIDKSEKQTKKFQGGLDGIGKAAKKILAAGVILAVIGAIKDVGESSIKAASDAEEANAKFNTAFTGIADRANETATALKNAYGLSQTESETLLGSTGDLLKGFGATADQALDFSNEIQKLSVDLASYNNVQGGASRVSRILTKSVLGNKDGLSELGVSLLDVDIKQELVRTGQDKLTGQAGKLAKAQATYTLILQQTGDAQGDFARTQDSYANQMKIAKARTADLQVELGRALLPTATKGIGVFSELTGKLGDYIKSLNDVKAAEEAQASGIATREQELLLLTQQFEAQNKKSQKLKEQAAFDQEEFGRVLDRTKIDKANSDNKLTSLGRQIGFVKSQIKEEGILAEQTKKTADAEIRNAKTAEANATARKKQHEDDLKNIEKIQEANKTDLEILNAEIEGLKNITGLTESENQKRLQAIEQLQGDKQRIIDEEVEARERAGEETLQANQEIIDAELEAEENKFDEKISLYEGYASQVLALADSIIQIANNITDNELANLERESQARIEALTLETEQETALNAFQAQLSAEESARSLAETTQKIADLIALGDEDSLQQAAELQRNVDNSAEFTRLDQEAVASRDTRASEIEDIEKELARKKYEIELAQFQSNKATSILEAGISTAAGIAASLPNLVLAGIVGGLGLVQVAAIASTPDPARPAFAKGGTAERATTAIVGEDGGEVMLGMGAQGSPLIDELATRIGSKLGGSGQTVININSLYPPTQQALARLAKDLYNGTVQEQQRRGI